MNYKILILSNNKNEEHIEDVYLKNRFEKDGNFVDFKWIDYNSNLDNKYDVIIRRNTWIEKSQDMEYYKKMNKALINRLRNNQNVINLIGLDGTGKSYLKDLYYKGLTVIPTTDILEDAFKWDCDRYVLKLKDSFGSGLGQILVNKEKLLNIYNSNYLIQPKLKFISEVQAYFINNKLMYAYEYIPSKYPNYPKPKLIKLTQKEIKIAEMFSNISDIKIGMKRIDFLRLEDNSLILLEIEDNSPHMNIEILDEKNRSKILNYYVKGIYNYIKKLKYGSEIKKIIRLKTCK